MACNPPNTMSGDGIVQSITLAVSMFPNVESSQPGTNIGRLASAAASNHESFGLASNSRFPCNNKSYRYS